MQKPQTLKPTFFGRSTVEVARDLIGCYLVRKRDVKTARYLITETEAYDGTKDRACHASKGRTKRTEVLFGKPGHIYIYFTYGMHWLLNFVVGPEDYPAGVLIRGVRDPAGTDINGPARVTKTLKLDGSFNGKLASKTSGLWVEKGGAVNSNRVKRLSRVGIDYAGPVWAKKKWRFLLVP